MALQGFIRTKQRQRAEQRPGRTQIFTESRDLGKAAPQEHRAHAHQPDQHHVSPIFQDVVAGQSFFLFEDGDFMQKFLHQSKGAQLTADKSPQQAAEQEKETQRGEGDLKAPLVQQRLERPDGARSDSSRAGIAVQPGDAGIFQAAAIDFPVEKAVQIPVCHDSKQQLYCQSKSFHSSPDPDALHADHHSLSPDHRKLALKSSDGKLVGTPLTLARIARLMESLASRWG